MIQIGRYRIHSCRPYFFILEDIVAEVNYKVNAHILNRRPGNIVTPNDKDYSDFAYWCERQDRRNGAIICEAVTVEDVVIEEEVVEEEVVEEKGRWKKKG